MKANVIKTWIDDKYIYILTDDGRQLCEAFADYARLRNATQEQRRIYEVDNMGIHWPELDEDLSFEGFFGKEDSNNKSELYRLFKAFPEINVAALARRLRIKQSLMAAYICGTKKPSEKRRLVIEKEIHSLGEELLSIKL